MARRRGKGAPSLRRAARPADRIAAGFRGFEVRRTATELGGEPAVVVDWLPGQDFSTRVVMVHNSRLCALTFAPMEQGLDSYEL